MASKRICTIPDCGKPHMAKGYCNSHYLKLYTKGDPLWSPPKKKCVEAMEFIDDVVMNQHDTGCLHWPFMTNPQGYARIQIDGKQKMVSRIVCDRVKGAPPSPHHEAAHSCGNGHLGCVSKWHLSWKTSKENKDDQVIHGTRLKGEKIPASKLTEHDVRKIISLKDEVRNKDLSAMFGVAPATISGITKRHQWKWIDGSA